MLAAICIPVFPEAALATLQQFRSLHDSGYVDLVAPHVTLVFPNSALAEADFIAHVASCVREQGPTAVEFPSAQLFREQGSGLEFVYLVPGAGYDWFVRLHQRLYSGPLAAQLRQGSMYLPHVTVGRFDASGAAAAIADWIRTGHRPISGRVDAIDIVEVGDGVVRHVHRQPLGR